jgi:hypothetical protein
MEKDIILENNFTYHSPSTAQTEAYTTLRSEGKKLAYLIKQLVPKGREQAVAMTNLEQALFWANAGIARNT